MRKREPSRGRDGGGEIRGQDGPGRGNCKGKSQGDPEFGILKKIKEVCMDGQHGDGETQGGWSGGGLWGWIM